MLSRTLFLVLAVLQALRRHLTDIVFFTTDLDARLWNPKHYKSTRNLIVASAYDVHPTPTPNLHPPIFRDVYQTAVFHACRTAVQELRERQIIDAPVRSPQLYEIGHNGPILLTSNLNEQAKGASIGPQALSWATVLLVVGGLGLLLSAGGGLRLLSETQWNSSVTIKCPASPHSNEAREPVWMLWTKVALLVLAMTVFVWVTSCWKNVAQNPNEEPWELVEGVSVWPTELFRMLAIILTIMFIAAAWFRHCHGRLCLWNDYFCENAARAALPVPRLRTTISLTTTLRLTAWRRFCRGILTWMAYGPALDSSVAAGTNFVPPEDMPNRDKKVPLFSTLVSYVRSLTLNGWPASEKRVNAEKLFRQFLWRGLLCHRLLRVVPLALCYACTGLGLVLLLGDIPSNPFIRGAYARNLDAILLPLTIGGFVLLLFYVLDAVRLTAHMLRRLADRDTVWPSALAERCAKANGVQAEHLEGWLDVQFAADKTRQVSILMYLPFIVLFLLLISHTQYFDAWTWPLAFKVIFAMNFAIAIFCWLCLRKAARQVKQAALRSLDYVTVSSNNPTYGERLKGLRAIIESERRGAYTHFIQDPAFVALLLPTGIFGILTILVRGIFVAF